MTTSSLCLVWQQGYVLSEKMKQERMGERMPDYRDDWRREREEREERENRRRFNNVNDDWNYPNRYGERGGGGYNGGGR